MFPSQSGIAIGPILFIIAVLAVLAAAIAAGSGSFTVGTTTEQARTQATALIQIGEDLKSGMNRLVIENGINPVSVIIDPAVTTGTTALFSPTGGGLTAPSVTFSAPASGLWDGLWKYAQETLPGFGTATGVDIIANLKVSQGVCDQINIMTNGVIAENYGVNLGMFLNTPTRHEVPSAWPVPLQGQMVGCYYNTNGNSGVAGYYFYQVLVVQ